MADRLTSDKGTVKPTDGIEFSARGGDAKATTSLGGLPPVKPPSDAPPPPWPSPDGSTPTEGKAAKTDPITPSGASVKKIPTPPEKKEKAADAQLERVKYFLDQQCAVTVTKQQLKCGVNRISGLGNEDKNRRNVLKNTKLIYMGDGDGAADEVRDLTNPNMFPNNIPAMAVLVARNTDQASVTMRKTMKEFNEVRKEVKAKYPYAADIVLQHAVDNHAAEAYKGYIKILAVSNYMDMMSKLRGEAILNWVKSIHVEVRKLSHLVEYIEQAKRAAFIASIQPDVVGEATEEGLEANDTVTFD